MKTIGMLGGMSFESTLSYYKAINEGVKKSLGGFHSAKILMFSVDFAQIEELQRQNNWQKMTDILVKSAQALEKAGADFLIICTNTMHKVAPQIEKSLGIPLLHIADVTAQEIIKDGLKKVALLGTKFTMEQDFYKKILTDKFGIEVLIPNANERDVIHNIIFKELCLGIVNDNSREKYLDIINNLYEKGAEAVILGCTEIALLVENKDTKMPLYDTTKIHAKYAVKQAIGQP